MKEIVVLVQRYCFSISYTYYTINLTFEGYGSGFVRHSYRILQIL